MRNKLKLFRNIPTLLPICIDNNYFKILICQLGQNSIYHKIFELSSTYLSQSSFLLSLPDKCLSWFLNHVLEEFEEDNAQAEPTTDARDVVKKLEQWHKNKRAKITSLKDERSSLQIKLQNALNECQLLRVQLYENLRETEKHETLTRTAYRLLSSF